MRTARVQARTAFVAALLILMSVAVPVTNGGSNESVYKLTGDVRPANADAFAGRPTSRFASVEQQPISLLDPDYWILSADIGGRFQIDLEATGGVAVGLVEVAEDRAAGEQLIAVGRVSAAGLRWFEAQRAALTAASFVSDQSPGDASNSSAAIAAGYTATHGFFSTFWMDPLGLTLNSVIDEAHWSYNGSTVTNLTGNDQRQWASWNGWSEISHSIGSYYNGNQTVGTVWSNANYRTSSWFPVPWCGTTNTYYQANNAYGFADGHIGGGVNTWATSGCLPFLSYTAFASPGS